MLAPSVKFGALTRVILGCALLQGCAYQPDSFVYDGEDFRGLRVTVDCVDFAIERKPDRIDGDKVLSFDFGNRCDQPAMVDLASVRIVGRTVAGSTVDLVAFDPRREIRPLWIDGRAYGREAIAYSSRVDVRSVCIDAASITHASPSRWLCFYGH
jgi:hypothetical protein